MNGGIIAANWGEGGNSLSNRGTVDMTGGYISGSIQAFSNTLYLSGAISTSNRTRHGLQTATP